ncbi:hypothetical protein M433DRAFT_530141 [Acidomyces richmondensis BFW]|nr:MAG: hypothetical protein FE78DRAFT_334185 [Acidomyces sp. 'richmondensis']KYG46919.1 hypothetical protein M433DRAFT_530141 [Acidomyces richmondensis BFW]
MASRRATLLERTPFHKAPWKPKNEGVQIPSCTLGYQPVHLYIRSPRVQTRLDSAPVSTATDPTEENKSLKHSGIVERANPSTWPRRGVSGPSWASSKRSMRQSEFSCSMLDNNTSEHSPTHKAVLCPSTTPMADPAMDQFDFELEPRTPIPCAVAGHSGWTLAANTTLIDAKREENLIDSISPPLSSNRTPVQHQQTYSLFPKIDGTTQSAYNQKIICKWVSPSQGGHNGGRSPTMLGHQISNTSYQPREESKPSSIGSRKDSFSSYRSKRCENLGDLASGSASTTSTTKTGHMGPASLHCASAAPQRSRPLQNAIMSPMIPSLVRPRTSFSSLLDTDGRCRDGTPYPACFFEDDEEQAPSRKIFVWKHYISLTQEKGQKQSGSRSNEKPKFVQWLKRLMLCSECSSARR